MFKAKIFSKLPYIAIGRLSLKIQSDYYMSGEIDYKKLR